MNAHDVDPVDRWGAHFHSSGLTTPQHTRPEWGRIADAIHSADRIFAERSDNSRPTPVRGDATWCRIAVNAYDRLTAADTDTDTDTDIIAAERSPTSTTSSPCGPAEAPQRTRPRPHRRRPRSRRFASCIRPRRHPISRRLRRSAVDVTAGLPPGQE